jgi:alkaline phosphatase D
MDRRQLLGYAGLGAGGLILGGVPVDPVAAKRSRRHKVPLAKGGKFSQGIAASMPSQHGIQLWTRLDGFERDKKLRVEVARDPDFRRVVARKIVTARAERDHTVETQIVSRHMKPGQEYYYRFETATGSSRVGRFRTRRPPDSRQPIKIAFFSCQDYQAGYFPAHSAIAKEDVDLAVCLGDYIYERNFYDGPRKDTIGANHDGEAETLAEYRAKYRMYKADPNLQRMHESSAFMGIWDDHEVEDNYTGRLPGAETMDVRVPFSERRAAAYRAYFEFMPFRWLITPSGQRYNGVYRRLRLGVADLFLLDERQYRDDQPCGDQLFVPCPEADSQPRNFLGRRQMGWLKSQLSASKAPWKLIGNQLMIMGLDTAKGAQLNKDSWDGYGQERAELMSHIANRGIKNVSFLTGDIHTFFAGDVGTDGRGPESHATEFVGGSITSLGIPETLKSTTGVPLTPQQFTLVTNNLKTTNPHLKYTQQTSRGYGLVTASRNRLEVTYRGVDALHPNSPATTIGRFQVDSGVPRVRVL